MILDLARGQYYALDAIGARLWTGLETDLSVEAISEQIAAEYDVSLEQAQADLDRLVETLVARGLLVI